MQKPLKDKNTKNPFDLDQERLASTSETGARVYFYPAKVVGFFRKYRNWVYRALIIFFIALPWIKVGGRQWMLLDVVHRRFSIFGLQFWGHDAPMLVLVLLAFVLFMGLITALWGRVWCGWPCPQTVFIDQVYRKIEEWIEGAPLVRKRRNDGPMTPKKFGLKSIKWGLYTLVSLVLTHSFLALFVGSDNLLKMIQHSPLEHPSAFIVILITTGIILFDFGWFREQFCIIACPYGRFQSVMMDENSLVVGYDEKRGEPRKKDKTDTQHGDCINCYRCVQVCPTGIDIRRGVQLECIMCTACIDACDTVMSKIGKPKGLVRYDSEAQLKTSQKTKYIRPRTIIYTVLLIAAITTLSILIAHRNPVDTFFVRGKKTPYVITENAWIRNQFNVHIHNQQFEDIEMYFESENRENYSIITPVKVLYIPAGKTTQTIMFIEANPTLFKNGNGTIKIKEHVIEAGQETQIRSKTVSLIGPL